MENRLTAEWRFQKGKENIYSEFQFHPYLEIYCFISGNAEYVNDNSRQMLSPWQIVIIPPGKYHFMNVTGDTENYTRCVFDIAPDFPGSELFEAVKAKAGVFSCEDTRIKDDIIYLTEMKEIMSREDFSDVVRCAAKDIMYSVKYLEIPEKAEVKPCDSTGKRIMKYIDDNLSENISVKSVSAALNYSESHISHIFKSAYGISVRDYIIGKRLNIARSIILSGEKAQKACMDAGFSDYSSFFRMYKKAFGISPSENKPRAPGKKRQTPRCVDSEGIL